MSSANEKLTALANEVRELSGTTTTKGIDTMISDIDAANAEISEQMGLIAQIATALEGKASGTGGGSSGDNGWIDLTPYASGPPYLPYRYEKPTNCIALIFYEDQSGELNMCTNFETWSTGKLMISGGEDNVLSIIITSGTVHHMFPIYTP